MLRTIVGFGILLAGETCLWARPLQSLPSIPSSANSTTLARYCITCHNERLRTAGLTLDSLDLENVSEGAEVWEKVVRKLRTGAMPPAGAPRPDSATYNSLATYLETELDAAYRANPNPGRSSVRRLNRAEYANVIRDLLGIEIDGASLLPPDQSGYGFDNIGDVLSMSPLLLERYMSAADKITRLAIADTAVSPEFVSYDQSKMLLQDSHINEDFPLGSRGGIAAWHYFPLDGEYEIKIHLQRNVRDSAIGLGEPHDLDVRVAGARIKLFTVGGVLAAGRSTEDSDEEAAPPKDADAGLVVRFHAQAGRKLVVVTFLNENTMVEGVLRPRLAGFTFMEDDDPRNNVPGIGNIRISGPYRVAGPGDTPGRRAIFACRPNVTIGEEGCARKILANLARRAYRRPVSNAQVNSLLAFYRQKKPSFEAGIRMALRRMLVDPAFLFRIERDPMGIQPETSYQVSDLELASRLSFFLWSSIPDDELLDLGEKGRLRDPLVLQQQIKRMLADSRSAALVQNFAGQWLYIRNMRSVAPDPDIFPEFDENLREAFRRESELLVETMLREDRSVLDLLDADYTFVNERLARHYGIPNIYGSHFRRVQLGGHPRRGLLGQGSILTVTSYATRTSPVLRGKWVMENILGAPPPPPPPNVPSLKEKKEDGLALTMRQRLTQHRARPACASCHAQMDPLGFALENFDAIGKWRVTDENAQIDASGVLPDGTAFQGPVELRSILLSRKEQFARTATEKLLTYALGRGLEYYDAAAVRKIMQQTASSGYRWSSLILEIVRSAPFQMRRSGK
jgi:hypothetical protein